MLRIQLTRNASSLLCGKVGNVGYARNRCDVDISCLDAAVGAESTVHSFAMPLAIPR